jgi:Fic family protein
MFADIGKITVTAQMLTIIAELDEFKGKWHESSNSKKVSLEKLKKVSTIESIGSSTRIEGNTLSDKEVEKLLRGIGKQSFRSRDEAEVAGYADLMNTIFDNYETIPLSENYIKQFHQILLRHVEKDTHHRGEYKKLSNTVAAFDAEGKELGIVFETATPFDTPQQMEKLINWTRSNLEEGFYHPLLVIGIFIVIFLAIHPFQDGNGRLSRALTTMLLLKSGYTYVPYSSLEAVIEANKDAYYQALNRSQRTLKDSADYEWWLMFFFTALQKQKRHLETKLETIFPQKNVTDTSLSRLGEQIVHLSDEQEQVTVQEIAEKFAVNINTVKKAVKLLVDKGYLIKHGTTRGAWYVRAGQ